MTQSSDKSKNVIFILIASFVGAVVSAILIGHHVNPEVGKGIVEAVCGTDPNSGCNLVNASDYSEVFSMPVAFWGFLLYGSVFVVSIVYLFKREGKFILQSIFILSTIALGVDFLLLIYSLVNLGTVCNLCLITYGASFAIVLFAYIELKKSNEGFFPNMSLIKNMNVPIHLTLIFSLLLVAVAGSVIYSKAKISASEHKKNLNTDDPIELMQKATKAYVKKYRTAKVIPLDSEKAPKEGSNKPSVIIVEFADYLCPHCKRMKSELKKVIKRCPNLIQARYLHYPLDSTCNSSMKKQLHAGSCMLSYASKCAQNQGRFWQIHDKIFEHQEEFLRSGVDKNKVSKLARSVGLNMTKFKTCMKLKSTHDSVVKDIELANKLGITGTPTIYINGKKMYPIEYFMDTLAIQEANVQFGGRNECSM